jgi:hypothetical protein
VHHVKDNRVSICIQDEFGKVLQRLKRPDANTCEQEIMERLKEVWSQGPGTVMVSPRGATEESVMLENIRLNLALFAVIDDFFAGCEAPDVIDGTLNRLVIFSEPKLIPMRRDFRVETILPTKLQRDLEKLAAMKSHKIGWSKGAEDLYWAEVDALQAETSERKRVLFGRTPQKIQRAATTFATTRFAENIDLSDAEIARAIMRRSDRVFAEGMSKADKNRLLDHAEMKREVIRRLKDEFHDHEASEAELKVSFKHNNRKIGALKLVLQDCLDTKILEFIPNRKTGGRAKNVYRLMGG